MSTYYEVVKSVERDVVNLESGSLRVVTLETPTRCGFCGAEIEGDALQLRGMVLTEPLQFDIGTHHLCLDRQECHLRRTALLKKGARIESQRMTDVASGVVLPDA